MSVEPDGAEQAEPVEQAEPASAVLPSWSRPPFEPGNTLALRHGGYSQRIIGPVADAFVQAVLDDPTLPWLHPDHYRPALYAWARHEARVMALDAYVDSMTMAAATDSGRGRTSYLELLGSWEGRAASARARLGLDPLSRARLGRDVLSAAVGGADLVQLMTAARARLDAADRAAAADGPTP